MDREISAKCSSSNPFKNYVYGKQSGQCIYFGNLRIQSIYKRLKYLSSNHRYFPSTRNHLHHFLELSIQSIPLTTTEDDINAIRSIPQLSLDELEAALKGMSKLRSADEDDMNVVLIKYANGSVKEALLGFLNQILIDGRFDESWHIQILRMLPKMETLTNFLIGDRLQFFPYCKKYFRS